MNALFEYSIWIKNIGIYCVKYCYDAIYDNINLINYVLKINENNNNKYVYSRSLFEFDDIEDDDFILCDVDNLR